MRPNGNRTINPFGNPDIRNDSPVCPTLLAVEQGNKGENPDELTLVSDSGKRMQLTRL
jgi:hypothetical protein